jgi:hypothetical protein
MVMFPLVSVGRFPACWIRVVARAASPWVRFVDDVTTGRVKEEVPFIYTSAEKTPFVVD